MPRTAIISDIHANLHALYSVIEDVQRELCTEVVCLGDIVGYNAFPHECLEYVRGLECPVVRGNHDDEVVADTNVPMNPMARQAMDWTRAQLTPEDLNWLAHLQYQRIVRSSFTIVHASLEQPKMWHYIINGDDARSSFSRQFNPVCFHGHTHVPKVFEWDGAHVHDFKNDVASPLYYEGRVDIELQPNRKYFVNAGSVGQPRDGDPRACYAIYDSDRHVVTLRRVTYDVEAARQAVLNAGLHQYLADRLLAGE